MNERTDCRRVRRWLARGPEPGPASPERDFAERHLDECRSCRRFAAELRRLDAIMAALPPPEAPPGFARAVMARLPAPGAAAPRTVATPAGAARRGGSDWLALWGTAAASVLAAVLALLLLAGEWTMQQAWFAAGAAMTLAADAHASLAGWLGAGSSVAAFLAQDPLGWWLAGAALLGVAAWVTGLVALWRGLDNGSQGDVTHA